jgi:hypothetical protein
MDAKTPLGGLDHEAEPALLAHLDRFEQRVDNFMARTWGAQAVIVVTVGVLAILVLFSPFPRPDVHLPGFPDLPSPVALIQRRIDGLAGVAQRVALPSLKAADNAKPETGTSGAAASCPSTASVRELLGVPVNTFSDACGFHWEGSRARVSCPDGYLCTFNLGSKISVVLGKGQWFDIVGAGTWRYAAAYPSNAAGHSACSLLTYERQYVEKNSQGTPVEAIGFSCSR